MCGRCMHSCRWGLCVPWMVRVKPTTIELKGAPQLCVWQEWSAAHAMRGRVQPPPPQSIPSSAPAQVVWIRQSAAKRGPRPRWLP